MEAALFAELLKNDPEAAQKQALATEAPKVAIDRLTAVAKQLLASDPDQAFAMAGRIFALDPEALINVAWVESPGSEDSTSSSRVELYRLLQDMVARDPRQTIGLKMNSGDQPWLDSTFLYVASTWAKQDLDGFAEWVNEQEDPDIHAGGAAKVIGSLIQDQKFTDAGTWVLDIEKPSRRASHLRNLVSKWARSDPQAAAVWVENAGLSPEEAAKLQHHLPEPP